MGGAVNAQQSYDLREVLRLAEAHLLEVAGIMRLYALKEPRLTDALEHVTQARANIAMARQIERADQ